MPKTEVLLSNKKSILQSWMNAYCKTLKTRYTLQYQIVFQVQRVLLFDYQVFNTKFLTVGSDQESVKLV